MKVTLLFCNRILVLSSALLVFGCAPVYYASNAHNVPMLKEKQEMHLNLGVTITEDLVGPDIQAAYAVTENIGIITNGTYLKAASKGSYGAGEGYLAEVAAGYFKPVGKKFVAEIYGGGGFAKVTNQRYEAPYSLKFVKPFIQPAFGFTSKYFDMAFSPKMAWVHYDEPFILNYEIQTDANGNIISSIVEEKQTFFAFEPGLTVRGGWKYTKLQLQAIYSFQEIPNAQNISLNLSLALNLAPRFRKIPE